MADGRAPRTPRGLAEHAEGLEAAARTCGTPAYVYFVDDLLDRVAEVRSLLGAWMGISYAVKANPNREILRRLIGAVDHLDVSSAGEIVLGAEAGWDPASFTFVGPAKTDWELDLALDRGCGWIVAESEPELRRLADLAVARGREARVLIRINPSELPEGFGVSMSRRPTIFGVDEEGVDDAVETALGLEGLRLDGFHVYAGTQCLVNQSLAQNLVRTASLFTGLIDRHRLEPSLLVFGSGFGIPYHEGSDAIDLAEIAERAAGPLGDLASGVEGHGGRLTLELGRYLVGEAGYYLARVVNVKATRGVEIVALDGGMNHHLAASGNLGGVIKRNYPIFNVTRAGDEPDREYDVAGPMCTNVDSLGRAAKLPETRPGDILAIACSGAYGLTASPTHFISHRPPGEVMVVGRGPDAEIVDVTEMGPLAAPVPFPARATADFAP